MEVQLTDFGATIVAIKVPDKNGNYENVVLRYPTLQGYVSDTASVGSTVGRYANRIAKAQFTLNGKTYRLAKNNGENTLHGGKVGFNKALWKAAKSENGQESSISFEHRSPDMDEGFPGTLDVKLKFTLLEDNELKIQYSATTDKDTVLNLTNHAYFNLAGSGDILNHILYINADQFTPVDENQIPTGELKSVTDTPFDFRKPKVISEGIESADPQVRIGKGYDQTWALSSGPSSFRIAARASDCKSGRSLEVWTTEPGIQFYTGNFLDGSFKRRSGFCLETQHFPDSPNKPQFPSTLLKAGEIFSSSTAYRFRTQVKNCSE